MVLQVSKFGTTVIHCYTRKIITERTSLRAVAIRSRPITESRVLFSLLHREHKVKLVKQPPA